MEVNVLSKGWEYEDMIVLSVHKTYYAANVEAFKLMEIEGGEWEKEEFNNWVRWSSGGVYFLIQTLPLQDA